MKQPQSMRALEELGRVRLSKNFFMPAAPMMRMCNGLLPVPPRTILTKREHATHLGRSASTLSTAPSIWA